MHDPKGSTWRKWDLHIHTPASVVEYYGGDNEETWEKFICDLEALPIELKVIGINDYIFIDGYRKVIEEKEKGRLNNIELILPIIELRLDKFGGSLNKLSKVNYHIIFSNEVSADIIQQHFLNALPAKYVLSPEYAHLKTEWNALPTKSSLEELGKLITNSVPVAEQSKFGPPLKEGFNNLCFNLDDINAALKSHYFKNKTLTAVGKTEWADIKWNEQSIAEKKTIINGVDLVFIASEKPEDYQKAKKALSESLVNCRLLDCSDAHRFSSSPDKDRIGNSLTWIKGDPTFEGLRQAMFEFESRVNISDKPLIEPILCINNIKIEFPEDTKIGDELFCFRGKREFNFSPNLTCLIGGRGTGKSTLLNLIHEKLYPQKNDFFKNNILSSDKSIAIKDHITIDNDIEENVIEFLSQNEVEQFALNQDRFTSAIFTRLNKLDAESKLQTFTTSMKKEISLIDDQIKRLNSFYSTKDIYDKALKELHTNKKLISSLQSAEYNQINTELAAVTKDIQSLRSNKQQFNALIVKLKEIVEEISLPESGANNIYKSFLDKYLNTINEMIKEATGVMELKDVTAVESKQEETIADLKNKLDDYLQLQGLSKENLLDISRANQKIAELEQVIDDKSKQLTMLESKIEDYKFNVEIKNEYETNISSHLAPINEVLQSLGSEVKPIEMIYSFDSEKAKKYILEEVFKLLPVDLEIRLRLDHLESVLFKIAPQDVSSQESLLTALLDEKKPTKTSDVLSKLFTNKMNFLIYKLIIHKAFMDVDNFKQIIVKYDGKPLQQASFGQRCTAAVVVLLLLGNTPIIIDEPEAHLDSSLIANYLVKLVKDRKKHRQIIFATHNANFVVNGDADLILSLSTTNDIETEITPLTIENTKHRDTLLALEGGKEAFKQRERRYVISRH